MSADISVVICSLNGAAGVDRCLTALTAQKDVELQVIVVDDGSTDDTSRVAREHGATVLRHETNRGLSAARNTGIRAATAPIVAFLDDDCDPEPEWARELLSVYEEGIIGVGGQLVPVAPKSFMLGFLQRNNPLTPLEMNLARSQKLLYRLYLYVLRQWMPEGRNDKREVYMLVGANMSFSRAVLAEVEFDERFRFGSDDLDIALQLRSRFPNGRLIYTPDAIVQHHFKPSLRDTLRRSHSYARGGARIYRKWPTTRPTIFPGPVLVLLLLIASTLVPYLSALAVLLPQIMYPKGLWAAISRKNPSCLLDSYVQLAQEALGNLGYIEGLWQYRGLVPEPSIPLTAATEHNSSLVESGG